MTDKQIIIDYKKLCENYSEEIGCYGTFDGSCIKEQCFTYKLLQQLQAKEQECEELKKQLMQKSEIDMFFNAPLEGWSSNPCDICRYKQTLTEIKEIAKAESYLSPQSTRLLVHNILQKISKYEVE